MSVLDLLAGFATSGHVAGAGIHSTPGEWDRALGTDYVDDRARKRFRRDYGLVELGFWRVDDTWRCGTISVQVHRLWWHPDIGPAALRESHGPFPKSVPYRELRDRLAERHDEPVRIEDAGTTDHVRYYVPATKVLVVTTSSATPAHGDPPAGAVWSLGLSDNPDMLIKPH